MIKSIVDKIAINENLQQDDLRLLLSISNLDELKTLYETAYRIKLKNVGNKVYFRGIIELSNICEKDCFYCGIRKSNGNIARFIMKEDEILRAAQWAFDNKYGSVVLQSGENSTPKFISFITRLLEQIKMATNDKLGITLSLGEQTKKAYQQWFDAGAHRYLLRIETSNRKLYKKLHPDDHDYEARLECLNILRDVGYQVGTGVMIGLPFQTVDDLANDIIFLKENDIDMIGMGPYLPHHDTPLAQSFNKNDFNNVHQLNMGLKMISATRIYCQDVNIAAATALQAVHPKGREMGIQAGANIIMPNITDAKYRTFYQLYDNKPCIDENSDQCRECLEERILNIGETIGYNERGDSPHFKKRRSGHLANADS